jgi:RHS repeat-associated protein
VLRTYYYDTNPLQSGFSQNSQGRLTAVKYPDPLNRFPSADPLQLIDMYSYTAPGTAGAGLPATKRLQVNESYNYMSGGSEYNTTETGNMDTTFTYNNEGKISSMTYPSTVSGSTTTPGPSYNYSYDSMYRLSGMTSGSTTIVNGVSYNAANQLAGITYNGFAESRTHNVLNQLITLKVQESIVISENVTYNYPTGANNGKLSSINNAVSGETVTYAYDSLNRLLTASGTGWGESYGFDPFGNLLSKTVTSGSGPSLSQTVNTANNRVGGLTYDANGNSTISYNGTQEVSMTYDAENRLTAAANVNGPSMSIYYAYDGQNRRIFSWSGSLDSLNNPINYTVNVYTPGGQKLSAYTMSPNTSSCGATPCLSAALATSDQYFGGRRLAIMDQLGSAGTSSSPGPSYFPWGEPRGTNPQDAWSYASYWTDSATGLDYANNRYYSNAYGRFMTPDLSRSSSGPSDPQSWNRYPYAVGDPVNRYDPSGLDSICPDGLDVTYDSGGGADVSFGGASCGGGGFDLGGDGDPTGYCPPSEQSCAPVPGAPGTGSPGGAGSAGGSPFQGTTPKNCPAGQILIGGTCFPYLGVWYNFTLPGTNWCGPGGNGPTLNPLDVFCQQHDTCYAVAGATARDNVFGLGGRIMQAAIRNCNVRVCKEVFSLMTTIPGPQIFLNPSQLLIWEDINSVYLAFDCGFLVRHP